MTAGKEKVHAWMFRHFGKKEFKEKELAFYYGSSRYSVMSVDSDEIRYGEYGGSLDFESHYFPINFEIKKTLWGPRMVFDLTNRG